MNILGISAYYHDSAAALLQEGDIIAAAQEERFSRKKHDSGFPANALKYCLEESGLALSEIDFIAFYDKPFLKFERLLETFLAEAPRGLKPFVMAMPVWLKDKLFLKNTIVRELREIEPLDKKALNEKLLFSEHHQAHAASAFFPSPFDEAAIITADGVGEWATTSLARGSGNEMEIIKEIHFPHSLGLLYSAITYYTGFKVNSGEYKLMGLAPYGEARYAGLIRDELIDIKDDGSFKLNMDYFNFTAGLTMTNSKFNKLFGGLPREKESPLTQKEMDLARSVQEITEGIALKTARHARDITGLPNLCLAGGVALNCVANGKLQESGIFDNIWIQPAAGDAGGAVGAAYCAHYIEFSAPRKRPLGKDAMKGALLGPKYSNNEVIKRLAKLGAVYEEINDFEEMAGAAADEIAAGKVIGWRQGRMEFGPRALGAASIVGDARNRDMQSVMNLKIKYRESFRPFAPGVLAEYAHEYFELIGSSPYMLLVANVKKELRKEFSGGEETLMGLDKLKAARSEIPAVTHVDFSARIQTVHNEANPRYWKLIDKFREKTGCAVIVNTSFNVRGEPIVNTPEECYRCFMATDMDILIIEDLILYKEKQPDWQNKSKWQADFEPD